MKENSIEETIKQLKLMLKVRKEQKDIIECAGGSCINCDPDIKALTESIDILSDYKRVLKENEEYKKAIDVVNKEKADWIKAYQEEKDKQFDLINKISSNDFIQKQKVKDRIEELKNNPLKIKQNDKYYYETDEYVYFIDYILDYEYGASGDFENVRELTENEYNKYKEIFSKVISDIKPGELRLVHYCYYNGVDEPAVWKLEEI